MNLRFAQLTPDNWRKVNALSVKEEQQGFVASNCSILARAFAYRMDNSQVHVLYIGDNPIGLIMQRDYISEEGIACVLDQMMIDKSYQGRGYGKEALEMWISGIQNEDKYSHIKLCYIKGDSIAEKLYRSVGFVRQHNEDDGDELVMVYELQS